MLQVGATGIKEEEEEEEDEEEEEEEEELWLGLFMMTDLDSSRRKLPQD
jgi:hypothetical protein